MADINAAIGVIIPAFQTMAFLVLGGGAVFGLWYWLFVVRRRKKWFANIWERKADGRLHLIDLDVIIEKRMNKGKNRMYLLKWAKHECMPPPWETTYRIRGKEYCDYLRIENDFLPIERNIEQEFTNNDEKFLFTKAIKVLLNKIKTMPVKEVYERYIYLPVNHTLATKIVYQPLDYDVNMMRINAIDNLDKQFKEQLSWLERWGNLLALGVAAGLFIVTLYLSFDYAQNIVNQGLGAAQQVAGPLQQIAERMGGTVPPS